MKVLRASYGPLSLRAVCVCSYCVQGQVRFRRAGSTSIDNTSLAIPGVAEESQSVDTSGEAGAAVEEKSSLANIAVQVPAVPPVSVL